VAERTRRIRLGTAAVHYAVRNYGDFPRLLERILIAGEPQYADL
jgi:taurine dioxygenase